MIENWRIRSEQGGKLELELVLSQLVHGLVVVEMQIGIRCDVRAHDRIVTGMKAVIMWNAMEIVALVLVAVVAHECDVRELVQVAWYW